MTPKDPLFGGDFLGQIFAPGCFCSLPNSEVSKRDWREGVGDQQPPK